MAITNNVYGIKAANRLLGGIELAGETVYRMVADAIRENDAITINRAAAIVRAGYMASAGAARAEGRMVANRIDAIAVALRGR